MGQLTEKLLQTWLKEEAHIAGKSDGDGLTFTMSASGTATWVLRYRLAGRARELTLGAYPALSLEAARKRARAERVRVDAGVDVALEKRERRLRLAEAPSFRELARHYLERARRELRPRTIDSLERTLRLDLLPDLGPLLASAVTPKTVVGLIERIGRRSDSVARRAFEHLSVIFAHGLARGAVTTNPCAGLKVSAILGRPRAPRPRTSLSLEELRMLFANMPRITPANALALKILLATCVRKSELVYAKREHIDLDKAIWTIPAEIAKSARGYVIPLAPAVLGWFRELLYYAGASAWVLPARNRRRRYADKPIHEQTLNEAIGRLTGELGQAGLLRHFSPHDLRATARTHLAGLGVDLIVAERCLNHSLGGLVAIYDKHDYLAERRRALELWAKMLVDLEPKAGQCSAAARSSVKTAVRTHARTCAGPHHQCNLQGGCTHG